MAHYKDLSDAYARNMEYHGIGFALFQPVAAQDAMPPCCGFFDRNGDWNLIARLSTEQTADGYKPLTETPHVGTATVRIGAELPADGASKKQSDVSISWQPKTSLGVQAISADSSLNTPSNLPGGAEAHVKYSSKSNFGAVLMTTNPVKLFAYNHERIFLEWLEANKSLLFEKYGVELKRYGLWIVTRIHTAPACSINAWQDNDKAAVVSLKAKAAMLGELGQDLSWQDEMSDKDWCHYKATGPDGVVTFMDGIFTKPWDWFMQSWRQRLRSPSRDRSPPVDRNASPGVPAAQYLAPPRPYSTSPPTKALPTHLVTERRVSTGQLPDSPISSVSADEKTLRDLGLQNQFSRSSSIRTASVRSPSLRRERRSVSGSNT